MKIFEFVIMVWFLFYMHIKLLYWFSTIHRNILLSSTLIVFWSVQVCSNHTFVLFLVSSLNFFQWFDSHSMRNIKNTLVNHYELVYRLIKVLRRKINYLEVMSSNNGDHAQLKIHTTSFLTCKLTRILTKCSCLKACICCHHHFLLIYLSLLATVQWRFFCLFSVGMRFYLISIL